MARETIHLITKSGPEWQLPIEAWRKKKDALASATELDKGLNQGDVFDRLSKHVVVAVELKGG